MKSLLLLILLLGLNNVFAKDGGGQEGGGGGTVHDTFIQYGKEVLYFLKNTSHGKEIVSRRKLNLCRLKETLNENLVFVYDSAEMIDHRGSIVDAYTYDWSIYIQKGIWDIYIKNKINTYHLVFKEMLRSEGTYFDKAIDISLELKDMPSSFKKASKRKWTRFLKWFEKDNSQTCLNKDDFEIISKNLDAHLITNEYKVPNCSISLKDNNQAHAADFLIEKAKSTQCKPVASKCMVKKVRQKFNNEITVAKTIYWKGNLIYHIPIVIKDAKTGKKLFQYPFMSVLNESIDFKLDDLYYAGLCSNKPQKSSSIPKKITIRANELYGQMQPNEILRPDNFLDCPFCKKPNPKVLGINTTLELISHKIKTHKGFEAKFVNVRVIKNGLSKKPLNGQLAKKGDEGWIAISSTKLNYYYNMEFDMLMDRD